MRTIWHQTQDAPRQPSRVPEGLSPVLRIGTWPQGPDQVVWVNYAIDHLQGGTTAGAAETTWEHNEGENSYWRASLPPSAAGDRVRYTIGGRSPEGLVSPVEAVFEVGRPLHVALMWHQHQPLYKDLNRPEARGSYLHPWVRLHALRDYYSMAALAAEYPTLHLTINLTPVLLWQLEDYVQRGATDRGLDLTLSRVQRLTSDDRIEILATFFEADWHTQIFRHPRYEELFLACRAGRRLTLAELRDLQMWFNLAWFGEEFLRGEVLLVTGEVASVRRFVEQGRGFSHADIKSMVAEQYKILRAIVPLHRQLQDRGQIEVATSPYYHPILPLIEDTNTAIIDREGTVLPPRFSYPEDAEAQVHMAVQCYARCFGRDPRGMWPAEGAVSQAVVPRFAHGGLKWIASDAKVLARSGQWGYPVARPEVAGRAYRAETEGTAVAIFFRDPGASDSIGFAYQHYDDPAKAVQELIADLKARFVAPMDGESTVVVPIILDGENAWGAYRDSGRPFLRALYQALTTDPDIDTVTFSEWLDGNPERGVRSHPVASLERVFDLFPGSWIDEAESAPGVDVGTWIGEPEENAAWELLASVRNDLAVAGLLPAAAPEVFRGLFAAEGSDWFWWYGTDQASAADAAFDQLFRLHLRSVYPRFGVVPPRALDLPLVAPQVWWTFTEPHPALHAGDRLYVRTNCPGSLLWRFEDGPPQTTRLSAVGGVMAGSHRHAAAIGPIPEGSRQLEVRFRCEHPGCDRGDRCCQEEWHRLEIRGFEPGERGTRC